MPLIVSVLLSFFSMAPALAQFSAELKAGIQTDRGQDPLPDGTKFSAGIVYDLGSWSYQFNYSHVGRSEVGNATVGTKLSTKEYLGWARYGFFKAKHIETYGGIGTGFKLDLANIRLYDEAVTEKSERQWLVGICTGAIVPFNQQIAANLELELLNQPGVDFLEVAILLGMSFRF
ncbi:MAG: hypothetical protein SGJ18_06895 [Pseudomonadota bacterium]|nr:hypothetical protein [Pseudomonadota bacterium]